MPSTKKIRTCVNGHQFYKSSDCPVCPVCEKENNTEKGFFSELSGPAKRALENYGILSLQKLSQYSEKEILQLHGIGPSSIPKLRALLDKAGLSFTK